MNKFPKLSIATAALIILSIFGYASGYRLDGLSAARANTLVPKDSVLIDEVMFSWGGIYVFDSSEKPVTAISTKKFGLLWTSKSSVWQFHHNDSIKTIGSATFNESGKKATILCVLVNDSNISYIEAGPGENRIIKHVQIGEPLTFSWEESIQTDRLSPKAFDKNGKLLFDYRYPETSFIRQEDLKWYPVKDILRP
ncbi:hypothetical protein D3P08_03435 [Paenibacillus nanensis]|uniref:Uncharacterized protein n=1 Tax=Paenibacillus nanensis TaxID=393251 RepID=A0A3A1VFV9_9BACL|nr:hypothetical protein [Paenibacillus nanensis]RIX59221.1 hypothetical protein D3P08_03435 [Paenibacillus nanensis]